MEPGQRRIAAWLACALVAVALGCAPARPVARPEPAPHTLEVGNAFLWQATRDGPEVGRLYLLGSLHVLDVPVVLGPRLAEVFAGSEELLVELDPASLHPLRLLDTASAFGRLAPLESLRDHLDDASYQRLLRFLDAHPPPERMIEDVDRTQPWLLWLWVATVLSADAGLGPAHGVDVLFMARAGDWLPVAPLETPADQFGAMASVPVTDQAVALVATLEAWEEASPESREEMQRLVEAWKAGDEETLRPLTHPDLAFAEQVLFRRNELMSARLSERLERGGTRFAVVGTLHLLGERSVVEHLRERGYRVERVR